MLLILLGQSTFAVESTAEDSENAFDPFAATTHYREAIFSNDLKNYKNALEQLQTYKKDNLVPSDQIWAARVEAYIYYRCWDERQKHGTTHSKQTNYFNKQIDKALAQLDVFQKQYKDDHSCETALLTAKNTSISIDIGRNFRLKRYLKVLEMYDQQFWQNPPQEASVFNKCINQMCSATYKQHLMIIEGKNAYMLIRIWPHLERAHKTLVLSKSKYGFTHNNASKALYKSSRNLNRLAQWLLRWQTELPSSYKKQLKHIVSASANMVLELVPKKKP